MLLFWCLSVTTGLGYLLLSMASYRLTQRLLSWQSGAAPAAPFDVADGAATRQDYWLPRLAALLLPWVVFFCLLVVATLGRGLEVSSNRVEVLDGPAASAGMRSGDRVLSVDHQPTRDFDAIKRGLATPGSGLARSRYRHMALR
jgi:hypothetical protein